MLAFWHLLAKVLAKQEKRLKKRDTKMGEATIVFLTKVFVQLSLCSLP